jgi:hypothetical protein
MVFRARFAATAARWRLWHGASSPWSRYSGTSGCTQPDQQERRDLLFHARKIAWLLLIRPAYGTTPQRTAADGLAAHATLAAAGIVMHPNAGRICSAQQNRDETIRKTFHQARARLRPSGNLSKEGNPARQEPRSPKVHCTRRCDDHAGSFCFSFSTGAKRSPILATRSRT